MLRPGQTAAGASVSLAATSDVRVDLPEVAVFASGRYATVWDSTGRPIAWSDWTDADLQRMAENDAKLRATGQPAPYIKPSHDAEPIPGFVGPLRYQAGKLFAEIKQAAQWVADQVAAGLRPWRSAEILRSADAANYIGVDGPVFKGIALLNTHPRVKTLDSAVYSDIARFEEPSAVGASVLVSFEEAPMPTADQVLAALKALSMDDKLLVKVLDALGLSTQTPDAAAPPAPMADKKPDVVPMSDAAAAKLQKLEADNALLRAGLEETRNQRKADVQLARTQKVVAFADAVSLTHGRAVADRAKASAEARFKGLPASENFADGKDLVAEVFAEIAGLIGPATVKRPPAAAGTPARAEAFSDEQAKEEIFADIHPTERAFLLSKDGESLLKSAIAKRKAQHEEGV